MADEAVERDENFTQGLNISEAQNALFGLFQDEPAEDGGELETEDEVSEEEDHDEEDLDVEDDADDEDDLEDEDDDIDESDDDDDDDDSEEDPDSDAEPTYKVKVDGEEIEVTVEELQSGFMRQKDYTQKTMAVAEDRKALREQEEAILGLEQEYEQNLEVVAQVLTGGLGFNPDWSAVKAQYPDEWKTIRENWMERQDQISAVRDQMVQVRTEAQKRVQKLTAAKVVEEQDKLLAQIPEWNDKAVAKEEIEGLTRAAKRFYGIEADEFAGLTDHRLILVLRDAMRAREMDENAEKGKEVRRKTRRKSKNPKSSTSRKSKATPKDKKAARAARKRLAQSGAIRDAEAALLNIFE